MVTKKRRERETRGATEGGGRTGESERKKLVGIYPCFHVMFDVFMSRSLSREKA